MAKKVTNDRSIYTPLVVTGYILFALLLIGVLISTTIPMGLLLFEPQVKHYNVAIFAITLTVGVLLPLLLGYIIGGQAVKSRKKIQHHFNGMLFGLLAYWLMMVAVLAVVPFELFGDDFAARSITINSIPSIFVGIVTAVLVIMHARGKRATRDVIDYKPFSITLVGTILLLQGWSIIHGLFTNSVHFNTFVPLLATLVLGSIAYASLRKTKLTPYSKLTWAAVAVSVAFIAVYVLAQFVRAIANYVVPMPTMEAQTTTSILGTLLTLVGVVVYWVWQRKALVGKQAVSKTRTRK